MDIWWCFRINYAASSYVFTQDKRHSYSDPEQNVQGEYINAKYLLC